MAQAKKQIRRSGLRLVRDFQKAQKLPDIPEGFEELRDSPRAQTLWKQYMTAREGETWLPAELVQVCRLVKTDLEIERIEAVLEDEGDLIPDRFGVLKVHPYTSLLASQYHRRAPLMRVLGLVNRIPKTADQRKRVEEAAQARKAGVDRDIEDDLLASPEDNQ